MAGLTLDLSRLIRSLVEICFFYLAVRVGFVLPKAYIIIFSNGVEGNVLFR